MANVCRSLIFIKIALIFSHLSAFYCLETSASSVIVDSPFGKIRGVTLGEDSGDSDQSYVAFWNIPYAKPPIGKLRFAKPEPHPKLDDVFDASNISPVMCIQPANMIMPGMDQGSEDCLILNIVAKNVNTGHKLKKVVVYIHGGAFVIGAAGVMQMGSLVKTHDVISVTINYRLGVLGFLSTGNKASPGNYGLWDQTLALQWVKDNIEAFGGDPNDVTLTGCSAGGASVVYQMLSPLTEGLFTKAFPQSGGATSIFARSIDVQKNALSFAKTANCWQGEVTDKIDLKQSESIMECMRSVDTSVIALFPAFNLVSEPPFSPSVDGDFVPRKPSLLLQDESYLESIGFYDRTYLVSLTNNEQMITKVFLDMATGMIRSNNQTTQEEIEKTLSGFHNGIRNFFVKTRLDMDVNMDDSTVVESAVDFYRRRIVDNDVTTELSTDLTFLLPTYDLLNALSRKIKCKSWLLHFDHFPAYMKGPYKGTVHGGDQMYIFDMEDQPKMFMLELKDGMDEEDRQLKSMYLSMLAEFMKTGDPTLGLKDHLTSEWPIYDPVHSNYLNFNPEPTVRRHLQPERRDLWLNKLPSLVQKMQKAHEHSEL